MEPTARALFDPGFPPNRVSTRREAHGRRRRLSNVATIFGDLIEAYVVPGTGGPAANDHLAAPDAQALGVLVKHVAKLLAREYLALMRTADGSDW